MATALWGPVLAWIALELLAEAVRPADVADASNVALDLFDRLRLRDPLGQAFAALGFEGEEGWRVAARMKVALLAESGILAAGAEERSLANAEAGGVAQTFWPSALWNDADVRWLTGVHEAAGLSYFVQEPYEELLWWLQLPALQRLACQAHPERGEAQRIAGLVEAEEEAARRAGYRIDAMYVAEAAVPETAAGLTENSIAEFVTGVADAAEKSEGRPLEPEAGLEE
jgi:hypothetical protein